MAIAKIAADKFVELRATARRHSSMSASPLMFDWGGTPANLRPNVDLLDDFRLDLASRRETFVSADLRVLPPSRRSAEWRLKPKATFDISRRNECS